ncbi:deaminase [Arthrobacter sp. AQ5-05]|uniref:dihydrofolate reductase family protein n=1 Tax=Arthrobacter sp. AQ5-05 TaxID=2184581 RepID=UPI000DCCD8F9|nr:dihydrofolate reductase family protein [Arthrobacter sp. AQ5-05]RAX49054.1 deaminase [Arthrobacter sp. AQ5-05]
MGNPYRTAAAGAQIIADVQESDALLLGRTTYGFFAGYWPGKTDEIGVAFDAVPKYLASRGTPEPTWENTTQLVDAAAALPALLAAHRQIHTWGSADLLQSLFKARLVDQLNLWVYPVVLGTGKKLFPPRCGSQPLRDGGSTAKFWHSGHAGALQVPEATPGQRRIVRQRVPAANRRPMQVAA